jgi:O-antigen ligase
MERWGTPAMTSRAPVTLEAHDVALSVLGQTGLVGLVAFAAFVVLALRGVSSARPALFAALVGTLVYHGLFAALEDARHLWVLPGMVAAEREPGDR